MLIGRGGGGKPQPESGCPSASYKPPTTTGFMITGSASVTGNGGYPPFAPQGQTSPLTVCVTGGTQVGFSNMTLVFGMPASGHFGSQAINGSRSPEIATMATQIPG